MNMKNHLRAGFSLLEIAIVLVIIGIVLGAGMPSLLRYREQACFKETKERQELITRAIATYVVAHGKLPCPAHPSDKKLAPGTSMERCVDNGQTVGIVPYRTLGLSEMQVKDGFRRYMTYAVFAEGANDPENLGGESRFCSIKKNSTLKLLDLTEKPLISDKDDKDFLAMILISHGPMGHGAFTGGDPDRLKAGNPSKQELVNGDATMTFYDGPYHMGDKPFRNIVKWTTRNNLMGIYGGDPCNPARRKRYEIRAEEENSPNRKNPGQGLGDPHSPLK
jgi:prepilin-type N-terminal cleavage/methylation domain-containing protein